jgi:thiamine-monophosphate kinase
MSDRPSHTTPFGIRVKDDKATERGASGEDRLLRWLAQQTVRSKIGDDGAILPGGDEIVATVDSQIAGVHFVADLDAACLAERLLAVNLSDLAAMGAAPTFALLALTAPPSFPYQRFFRALLAACARHRMSLAGGDLSRAGGQTLIATLTLLGRKPRSARWLRRSAASAGDALWLGGTVGESAAGQRLLTAGARLAGNRVTLPAGWPGKAAGHAAKTANTPYPASTRSGPIAAHTRSGPIAAPSRSAASPAPSSLAAVRHAARQAVLRHLRPQPQLALGRWLGRQTAGAAMDVSDGVALDLSRLCSASRVGAHLEAAALPYAEDFTDLCAALGVAPQALALHGGEDYVLLFTLPPAITPPRHFHCHRIGTITAQPKILITHQGKTRPLPRKGWDHLQS